MNDSDKLKQLEEQLRQQDEAIEQMATDCEKQGKKSKQSNIARAEAQKALQAALNDNEVQAREHQILLNKLAQERLKGLELRDSWNALKRKMAVDALVAQQPSIWDVLPKRMQTHQETHNSNLVGIDTAPADIAKLVEGWQPRNDKGRGGFSRWDMEFRAMLNSYDRAIRDVCELSVDQKDIPLTKRQAPNLVVDTWLMQPSIMTLWAA